MANKEEKMEIIREVFLELSENFMASGTEPEVLKRIVRSGEFEEKKNPALSAYFKRRRKIIAAVILPICLAGILKLGILEEAMKTFYETRCIVPNNYFVWEFTRPVSDCDYCRNVKEVLILPNLTRKEFMPFAYSSRPIVVKGAAAHWKARNIFNVTFFRDVYESIDDAYATIEEDCQFLQFKSNFENLRQVLEMSDKRASNDPEEESWYVGWKNCHPEVLKIINQYFEPPHFLPEGAEIPATSYIFLGYEEGAVMHLDYIPRLMWQGQIIGSKTWFVAPTPECATVCQSFNFSVGTADILLLDTRIWYHGTRVDNGELSLTITSEYG